MALKAETKKKIAEYLKIKDTDLDAAIKDEKEVDLPIPEDLQVLTKDELETRDSNNKKTGETAGREMGMKEVKKAAGLPDDAPSKDPVKLAQAIVNKGLADAKINPDEKVGQLNEQVQLLQTQLLAKDTEVANTKKLAADAALDRSILAAFPKERGSNLNDEDYLTLVKRTYTFKEHDGKIIVEKEGKVLRHANTQDPLPLAEAVGGIFTERKWVGEEKIVPGGRGGGNNLPAGGFTKLSDLKKHYADQNKSMLGQDFAQDVEKAAKDNKDFDMNS